MKTQEASLMLPFPPLLFLLRENRKAWNVTPTYPQVVYIFLESQDKDKTMNYDLKVIPTSKQKSYLCCCVGIMNIGIIALLSCFLCEKKNVRINMATTAHTSWDIDAAWRCMDYLREAPDRSAALLTLILVQWNLCRSSDLQNCKITYLYCLNC